MFDAPGLTLLPGIGLLGKEVEDVEAVVSEEVLMEATQKSTADANVSDSTEPTRTWIRVDFYYYDSSSVGCCPPIIHNCNLALERVDFEYDVGVDTIPPGPPLYYDLDPLGSPAVMTDAQGNNVQQIWYYAFGATRAEGGMPGTPFTTHKFTGKELDETGLYYYGARYYDTSVGRFISLDPFAGYLRNPQSQNKYVYCMNNPVNLVDPLGFGGEGGYRWHPDEVVELEGIIVEAQRPSDPVIWNVISWGEWSDWSEWGGHGQGKWRVDWRTGPGGGRVPVYSRRAEGVRAPKLWIGFVPTGDVRECWWFDQPPQHPNQILTTGLLWQTDILFQNQGFYEQSGYWWWDMKYLPTPRPHRWGYRWGETKYRARVDAAAYRYFPMEGYPYHLDPRP